MPVMVDEMDILQRYVETVMTRVTHHAGNVGSIALAILGAVIWRAQHNTIRVRPYRGALGNVLHFTCNGVDYAFRYEHSTQEIQMLRGGLGGTVMYTFTNATPVTDVEAVFRTI